MYFALAEQRPLILFCAKDGEHLDLYPASEWEQVQRRTETKARQEKKPHLTRLLNARAQPISLDSDGNGRILIPQQLVNYFKPDDEVVFIGNTRKIELWSAPDYQAFLQAHQKDFELECGDLLDF